MYVCSMDRCYRLIKRNVGVFVVRYFWHLLFEWIWMSISKHYDLLLYLRMSKRLRWPSKSVLRLFEYSIALMARPDQLLQDSHRKSEIVLCT